MSAVDRQSKTDVMGFALRPLGEQDIPQSAEIEREAFPGLFPATSFRRELRNRLARYLVAWRRDDQAVNGGSPGHDPAADAPGESQGDRNPSVLSRLFGGAQLLLGRRQPAWQPGQQFVAGFLGTWYMPDEAHIVSVGVRKEYRGCGIGELLLIGAIEQAVAREENAVTLEVRESNCVARSLYLKYGFTERGVRKRYYTDNGEHAVIMTTDPILRLPFQQRFRELAEAHERRWGRADRVLY